MALVKYGAGIIQMSGSIAGNTYARNRYGNYVRAKTKPINPNTDRQAAVRAAIATLTARWSQVVTDVQRTAWNLYASSVNMKNKLGEVVKLSGFNHYIRSNAILQVQGMTLVDAGPTIFELPEQDPAFAITASAGTQKFAVVFDDAAAWVDLADCYLHLFQGQPQNAQRNFFAGPWRYCDSIAGAIADPETTPYEATSVFVITEDQRLNMYGRIQLVDGRLSEPFSASCFCAV